MDLAPADLYPPTDPALLAALWGAVSAVHRAQELTQRYFDTTEADALLAERLSLLPVLLDWVPASEPEAVGLTRALRGYADRRTVSHADEEAAGVIAFVKQMVQERGRIGLLP